MDIVKNIENDGAGEIILNSINRDGTWKGFDVDIIKIVSDFAKIPIIANCGAGNINHINEVFSNTSVSAVALGSMVLYQKKDMGVLVNFPDKNKIKFS